MKEGLAHTKEKIIFTGFAQNDFQEFILFIIDCFHNSMKREVIMNIKGNVQNKKDILAKKCYGMMQEMYKKEYSEIISSFYGIHTSQIISKNDEILSVNPEPFFMIDLPIKEGIDSKTKTNLYECFDLYTKPELLEGDNAWYNEKTKSKEDVGKKISFWSLPDILVISLKRFEHNMKGEIKKIQSNIDFPLSNLDLTKYVDGYNSWTYIYDLYGICNHSGGPMGGHYTAYVKNLDGNWYHFNDTHVNKISESELITNKAYCLFYRKKKKI